MTLSRTAKKFYHEQLTKKRVSAASIVTAGTLVATQSIGATSAHASGGVFTVSNCDDTGNGSLRQAMQDAYDFNDPSQIVFVSALGCSTITPLSDLPIQRAPMDIVGPGAQKLRIAFSSISSSGLHFSLVDQVNVSGLTLSGRGVTVDATNVAPSLLHVNGVDFENITDGASSMYSNGSFAGSQIVIENSTFGHSGASGTPHFWSVYTPGSIVVDNSTFVGNVFQEGVLAAGAGISISNSTFVANTFDAQGGQFSTFDAGGFVGNSSGNPTQLSLYGNLFANNVLSAGPACFAGAVVDNGANIFDVSYTTCTPSVLPTGMQANGASAVIPGVGSTVATSAALNGGTTPTVALLAGSPAIDYYSNGDSGTNFQPASLDQRGLSRPFGAGNDVGAFEYRPAAKPPVSPSATCKPVAVGPVNFKRDSAVLTTSAKSHLNKYVTAIAKSTCRTITLNGYAAAPGHTTQTATKHRIKLASARAAAVKSYLATALKAKGITVKFKVNALGARNPVASNKTESGRRLNRRVEVSISKLRALN